MFNGSHNQEIKKNKINNSYKISIIVSQWNNDITELLYDGAISKLLEYGIKNNNIQRYDVPGSMELVFASEYLLNQKKDIHAIICLGCVIKGKTDHDKYISSSVSKGLMSGSLKYKKPVIFGALTTNNKKQGFERSGGRYGYKGEEAALTVIKILDFFNKIN